MKRMLLIFFLVGLTTVCYLFGMQRDLSQRITRLHIVANSNSDYDQNIKIKVRDDLLKNSVIPKSEIKENLEQVSCFVNEYLKNKGIKYSAKVQYKTTFFPTKEYKNISLPKGNYKALNIILGEGKGENWWCVMFPPLCFTKGSVGELNKQELKYLEKNLKGEELSLIRNDINIKFKLIELINSFENKK